MQMRCEVFLFNYQQLSQCSSLQIAHVPQRASSGCMRPAPNIRSPDLNTENLYRALCGAYWDYNMQMCRLPPTHISQCVIFVITVSMLRFGMLWLVAAACVFVSMYWLRFFISRFVFDYFYIVVVHPLIVTAILVLLTMAWVFAW